MVNLMIQYHRKKGTNMSVSFGGITKGRTYTRDELALMWGYEDFHAIARGVFTPAGQNIIVLFVTEEKQETLTPYTDRLQGRELMWEGESGHRTDMRITTARENGEEIHVLYRQRHHQPFTYLGQFQVEDSKILTEEPSRFRLVEIG